MTIDERLNAISMHLEVIAGMQHYNEKRLDKMTAELQQDAENIRNLAHNSQLLHDSIKALENIATAHEQRLDNLEGQ